MKREDSIQAIVRFMLISLKHLQIRMELARSIVQFKGNDKHVLNNSINRVKAATNDILNLLPSSSDKQIVIDQLQESNTNMINVVAFIDEAMNLTEEEVGEIAEIINEYLNKKHGQSL
jgi:hypothetical protein